jgi:uncharacterized protein
MEFILRTDDLVHRQIDCIVNHVVVGEITWKEVDGVMHMNHTYVSPKLRGQGVAEKLLDEAASYARSYNLRMNPICSYVVMAFQKSNKYADVSA